MKLLKIVPALVVVLATGSVFAADSALKTKTLCGWFSNPTPNNASLLDRSAEWVISQQGMHQAEGDWPEFRQADPPGPGKRTTQWVHTNGSSYGYGCACITGVVNIETKEVVSIASTKTQSLSVCKKDRTLSKPD
jgi:hypothetical protein